MAPNFTRCGDLFTQNSAGLYAKYSYNGSVHGIVKTAAERPALITLQGCKHLCGSGSELYPWPQASNTITTWVLPVIGGLLLQAPFESNRFWRTIFAVTRWLGSPISSLSYVLWNISVTGKCALMVDMSTRYDEVPDEGSEFSQMRDAFYILAVMNQFSIKPRMPGLEAEKLLRVALFSNSLKLAIDEDAAQTLVKKRTDLAKDLRRGRRRGIVPVFISLGWFLFSLGISIESAFGNLGQNSTAHNLALGLLLGWLPVFIMGSIIDRNPMSSDDIRLRINNFLDAVRLALLNHELRDTYMRDTRRTPDEFAWTTALEDHDFFQGDFFVDFAGQGRSRWHYGVAHPILAGIEDAYVADYGRDWLRDPEEARTHMVLGPKELKGLRWFDPREFWQILSAVTVVVGTVAGGKPKTFIMSFFTPTVGLGCRSGGYMVFVIIAFFSLLVEMLVWWQVSSEFGHSPPWMRRASIETRMRTLNENLERHLSGSDSNVGHASLRSMNRSILEWWEDTPFRQKMDALILRPIDVMNTCWLIYIVSAQTFGWYQTCECMASTWGPIGGYIDFETFEWYRAHGVAYYWGAGTAVSCTVLSIATAYIVAEWCSQSHLVTENYESARKGLRRTRWFKKHTRLLRALPNAVIEMAKFIRYMIRGRKVRYGRRSLVFNCRTKRRYHAPPIVVDGLPVVDEREEQEVLLQRGRKVSKPESISLRELSAPSRSRGTTSPGGSFEDVADVGPPIMPRHID